MNEGIKIYYEARGQGPSIIMLHGFPGSHEEWNGYIEEMKERYQLIAIDIRGNGKSDKPHNSEEYLTKKITSDIIAVLDDLQIKKAHCWGYSFGGYIAFCLSRDYPERFASFIIGGSQPCGLTKETVENLERGRVIAEGGLDEFLEFLRKKGENITPETEKYFSSWDFTAIEASINSKDIYHSVDEHLPELDLPFLLYAGEFDEWNPYPYLIETSKKMKNAKTILFEGKGHGLDKELILPHVLEFLEQL